MYCLITGIKFSYTFRQKPFADKNMYFIDSFKVFYRQIRYDRLYIFNFNHNYNNKTNEIMNRREEFSFLKGTWKQIKKLNTTVNQFIDDLNSDKLYAINYSNLRRRFIEEIENYKNNPELIDIEEFSMNYSFGYHYCNNIDDMHSKEAMFIEVKGYLNTLTIRA